MTRQDLVQLTSQEARYLRDMPERLAATCDVALCVGDHVLPVHSYIMAASSDTFAGQLAAQDADFHEGITRLSSMPYTISLGDEELETVQHVLQYMYMVCPPREGPAEVSSRQKAEQLASFGHKYGVQYLLRASDAYMQTIMKNKYALGNGSGSALLHRYASEEAPEVLRVCSLAESNGLQQTEDYCSRWLACFIKDYPAHHPDLFALSKNTLVKVLKSVSGV